MYDREEKACELYYNKTVFRRMYGEVTNSTAKKPSL